MLKIILAAGLITTLLGCASESPPLAEDFGAAVKHNMALQIINPEGVENDDSASMDGRSARQAVERHRQPPVEISGESLIEGVSN